MRHTFLSRPASAAAGSPPGRGRGAARKTGAPAPARSRGPDRPVRSSPQNRGRRPRHWGCGPPRYLRPERVRLAARTLRTLTHDLLISGVTPADLTRARVYPFIWDEPGTLARERHRYDGLVQFFEAAAAADDALLVWLGRGACPPGRSAWEESMVLLPAVPRGSPHGPAWFWHDLFARFRQYGSTWPGTPRRPDSGHGTGDHGDQGSGVPGSGRSGRGDPAEAGPAVPSSGPVRGLAAACVRSVQAWG
ncbi:DUF1877 family protein [Streptomyces sp. LB8]|uniref:DUF1877 family protein n=1 Tax=Streptomyces TaxID=1883 RepID=UPI002648A29C|nr:DUF1877 family protein [Streptomyces sp. LB8]MDN5382734.1 DUF1877 family protein [Streptomyces sp. LB8]